MHDFSQTRIRCSAIGLIMSDGVGKSPRQKWEDAVTKLAEEEAKYAALDDHKRTLKPAAKLLEKIASLRDEVCELEKTKDDEPLSEGAKTYLTKLYAWEKYGKRSITADKGSKYTSKGKLVEEDAIDLYCRVVREMYQKNDQRINNDFLSGEPDLFRGEHVRRAEKVIDIKAPWDIETFFYNLGKPLNSDYHYQVHGYMALTGAEIAEVAYCLVSSPDAIINDEKYRLFKRLNPVTEADPHYMLAEAELVNNMTFEDIAPEDRVLRFPVERDDALIEKIYRKVQKCRDYLQEIERMHREHAISLPILG